MASVILPKVARSDARVHAANEHAAQIAARVNRLPSCKPLWVLTCYVALAGIFELYDLFQTGYLTPALIRAGVLNKAVHAFGMSDQALFASATFLGLFAGSAFLSPTVDRFGRRKVFMWALIFYSASTAIMSFQGSAMGVIVFRFLAGVGLGVELVTTDAYLTEVLPNSLIGRAFALMHVIFYLAVPLLAFFSWQLMPASPFGIEGWRWVTIFGSFGALLAWILGRGLMESPRWLAVQGRAEEAEAVMNAIEASAVESTKKALPGIGTVVPQAVAKLLRCPVSSVVRKSVNSGSVPSSNMPCSYTSRTSHHEWLPPHPAGFSSLGCGTAPTAGLPRMPTWNVSVAASDSRLGSSG